MPQTATVGKRGTLVIPARLRKNLGLQEGSIVILESRREGLLVRPGKVVPVEIYTPERKAEFLLNNAVGAKEYKRARRAVRKLGLDPDQIPHQKPAGL
ncbi:MAG: AbrB/MazE/SpoVT family DNA-binding domain-containing protein [Planctomycetota bacterium]